MTDQDAPTEDRAEKDEPEVSGSMLTAEQRQRAEAVRIASKHVRRPSLLGGATFAVDAKPLIDLADYIITGFSAERVVDDIPTLPGDAIVPDVEAKPVAPGGILRHGGLGRY